MNRHGLLALLLALFSAFASSPLAAAEKQRSVYLEVMRSPPNRHVIAMNSIEECRRSAEFSKAKCVYGSQACLMPLLG